jgi:hypothetical protein
MYRKDGKHFVFVPKLRAEYEHSFITICHHFSHYFWFAQKRPRDKSEKYPLFSRLILGLKYLFASFCYFWVYRLNFGHEVDRTKANIWMILATITLNIVNKIDVFRLIWGRRIRIRRDFEPRTLVGGGNL